MEKLFNKKGTYKIRFKGSTLKKESLSDQVLDWLKRSNVTPEKALHYAEIVDDPVFGEAIVFPCTLVGTLDLE